MKTSDFYYDLPQELIAQHPTDRRDACRLLIYHRKDRTIEHKVFSDIIDYLNPGDALVINDTKVIPARLLGNRVPSGGKMELLLLKRLKEDDWECLAKPGKKAQPGQKISFGDGCLSAEVLTHGEEGLCTVRFTYEGVFEEALDKVGVMPLPPYIHTGIDEREKYQTVYAREPGSAAAPTAGLHFTKELLEDIRAKGIDVIPVMLHVGLGTFRPVQVDDVQKHVMHSEFYEVSKDSADRMNAVRKNGGRIICVGTTSVRTLETVTDDDGVVHEGCGDTNIFIYPGYRFKAVDALITNFHLPESTLLMLVSALSSREEMLSVYEEAVRQSYRFFSFGDAMLIE